MDAAEHDLVLLRTCSGPLEASVLRSLLEAHGIHCHYQAETHRRLLGPVAALGDRLLVPATRWKEADQILRASEQVDHGSGGYRDPYPLPAPPPALVVPRWRPSHTVLMVVFVMVVLAVAAFVRLSG